MGTDYHVKIYMNNDQIIIYFSQTGNSIEKIKDINITKNPLSGGQFGIGGAEDKISFDNVIIY